MTNPEDLIRRHRRLYSGMAFAGHLFDGLGQEKALSASISALEAIVAACPDRPIPEVELERALGGLPEGEARLAWHVGQLRRALGLPGPEARLQAARRALAGLRAQLGR